MKLTQMTKTGTYWLIAENEKEAKQLNTLVKDIEKVRNPNIKLTEISLGFIHEKTGKLMPTHLQFETDYIKQK